MGCNASKPADAGVTGDTQGLLSNSSDHLRDHKAAMQSHTVPTNSKPTKPTTIPKPKTTPAPVQTTKPFNRARDRIDAIEQTKTITIDGVKIRYAYLSQRGFYPDDPFKANQDAYAVHESITNDKKDAYFGVFDGHGNEGDGCAKFAKANLPKLLATHISKAAKNKATGANLTKEHVHTAILRAHVDTNKQLHKNSSVDDSLSGTTAISVYFHGRKQRITVANVGDSRAVLGQETPMHKNAVRKESGRNLKAYPLSRDQTPYRKDERNRIRATGARILSLDQLEGLEPVTEGASENDDDFVLGEELDEGGDPPRVWAPHGDYPGTAFTRSIGDAMAEDLGVFAEPEMLTRELVPEDKIIVLASDGVFEFLTNQSVIDICAKFADPLEACRAVVAEAYELWLQYELRTDDITMICLFVDEVPPDADRRNSLESSKASSQGNGRLGPSTATMDDTVDNSILSSEGLRPVRKAVSKEKSKEIERLKEMGRSMRGSDHVPEEVVDLKKLATKKTKEEKDGITEAIKASVMFRNISDEQREIIFDCMESVHVKKGTWVIRQGTVGDRFYIIDEGRFQVRILPDGMEDETGEGGNIVHEYEGSRAKNIHPSFGELALMYSAPRSASIVAVTDGHLWALHRAVFRQVLIEAQDHRKELKKVLGSIPYFQYLDSEGISKLAALMDEITFGRGQNITEQGHKGDYMYVIASGSCYTVQMTQNETKRDTLKSGSYFGDEIFSGSGNYETTVVSLQTTTCWQLDANVLKQTMGPLLQGGS